ncbi:hypothetical protein DPMN_158032 [Dreissena polymorpha]|uniref:Uncharacterized protein n=1 Tax=Dreissena polymorpha TaxID=45954 RepID=A0A9D4EKL9_DREPO|nr:hypothetical protein DPMN_158032 [Dreissena polymorpha]
MSNHDGPTGIPWYKYRVSLRVSRKISCIASVVVSRGLKLDRDTRDSDNTGDILPFTQSDTRYFARHRKRHTVFCTILEATRDIYHDISSFGLPTPGRCFVVHFRASLRVSRNKSCVDLSNAQNIVYPFVCRVSPLVKEGRDYRWHYPDAVENI